MSDNALALRKIASEPRQSKWAVGRLLDAAFEIERLRAELTTAREEGRRAGIEEAAKRCDAIAEKIRQLRAIDPDLREFDIAAEGLAAAIRALPAKEAT